MKLNSRSTAVLVSLLSYGHVMAQTAPATPSEPPSLDTVVTTGTRTSGLKAVDSPAPVQVLDGATLLRGGQPDLVQTLTRLIPSYTADAKGGDAAALTTAARLRGLSPNHTLILVDGKRRHGTSNVNVNSGSPFAGGASADLGLIPASAIDRIEVLQDGAAAQYGSDAIAGVINVILKKHAQGGSITADAGQYFDGDGETAHLSANLGLRPSEGSFLNLSADLKYHGHSDRTDLDARFAPPYLKPTDANVVNAPGYPYVNHTFGDASIQQQLLTAKGGLSLGGGLEAYTLLTAAQKYAEAIQNYRGPSTARAVYPSGFSPIEVHDEDDGAATFGLKGPAGADWRFDLSSTYGRDDAKVRNNESINTAWLADTGSRQTNFDEGYLRSTQWTTNFDLNRDVAISGWTSPLNVALGAEFRRDGYVIGEGELSSYYKGGAAAFPGYAPSDAGSHSRTSQSLYIDLAGSPIERLQLDGALRYEHYSDFGSATVGKLSGRFELQPTLALRGTASNGFRAPTLAEEYYSATQVSPATASVFLPNYSPAARLLGVDQLKPEKSRNLSLGLVFTPTPRLTTSLDVYQIWIDDRILQSGALIGTLEKVEKSRAVNDAIRFNGNTLPADIGSTSVTVFTNAGDSRTRGADLVLTYADDYAALGKVDWSVAANVNETKLSNIANASGIVGGQALLNKAAISALEKGSPAFRLNLGALWRQGRWTVDLRENVYGPLSYYTTINNVVFYENRIGTKFTTDLDVNYAFSKAWSVSVGANNLFNVYPDGLNPAYRQALNDSNPIRQNVQRYSTYSPIGINGGYYYARASYKF